MATKKRSGKRPSKTYKPDPRTSAAIKDVPESLRTFYELGLRVKQKVDGGDSRRAAARAIAKELGYHRDAARQALTCVERISEDDLIRLGTMHTHDGSPLSPNHLCRLAMVRKEETRQKLIAEIEQHGWTSNDLYEEIKRRKLGSGGTGGPKLRKPASLTVGLDQIMRYSTIWLRHHDELWAAGKDDWMGKRDKRETRLAKYVSELRTRLGKLAKAARGLEKRLARVESEVRGESRGTKPR